MDILRVKSIFNLTICTVSLQARDSLHHALHPQVPKPLPPHKDSMQVHQQHLLPTIRPNNTTNQCQPQDMHLMGTVVMHLPVVSGGTACLKDNLHHRATSMVLLPGATRIHSNLDKDSTDKDSEMRL